MPLMVWSDRLSVGVKLIDDDHKRLLSLANDLHDAIVDRRGKEQLGNTLEELLNYTRFHFAREEQFFLETTYAEAATHKVEHDGLTAQVEQIQVRFNAGSPALTLEVMNFLKDWLFDHILGSDAKFGPHLNSRGIH